MEGFVTANFLYCLGSYDHRTLSLWMTSTMATLVWLPLPPYSQWNSSGIWMVLLETPST